MLPLGVHAGSTNKVETIFETGSNGRNASTFRGSTAGGTAKNINYAQDAMVDRQTASDNGALIFLSDGGRGGEGHNGRISDTSGSVGGKGGSIDLSLKGKVTNQRDNSYGVFLRSTGGDAGSRRKGGSGGGAGGAITINADNAVLTTQGRNAAGFRVASLGGKGNSGFQAVGIRWSGSDGGDGGPVSLSYKGLLDTTGTAVRLASEGGAGGSVSGGIVQTTKSHGGTGGRGGNVQLDLFASSSDKSSNIVTTAESASGIILLSKGGAGGRVSGETWLNGADGGSGGAGGRIRANVNDVDIKTTGTAASGVLAESNGGSGFWGGGSALARGGKAGSGGDGGNISLTLGDRVTIETKGNTANGVQAVSRGGGGSNGGMGGGVYSPGADGSSGGSGGEVVLNSAAKVMTEGRDAHGLYAASLGGAAGEGGIGLGFWSVGGHGGANSHSARVDMTNTGIVHTRGEASHGLFAQSIGGAGGQHTASGQAALGGDKFSNSPGSDGSIIQVINHGSVTVEGKASKGILAQSIGGGGGNGGTATGVVAVGGDGKSSGDGNAIAVRNAGSITTKGELGYGIHAQSIGGGGGAGAESIAISIGATFSVGGKGGVAGNGGDILVDLSGLSKIVTEGDDAIGIVGQSIGGGGGDAGTATSLGVDVYMQALGGQGASGGHAGTVNFNTQGSIETKGKAAVGLLAQSVGGGGGIGGNSISAGLTVISIGVGGSGGSSGNGNTVTVNNQARINTAGDDAHGALIQSVGGGGGAGGAGVAIAMSVSPKHTGSAAIAIGGTGGNGGEGGAVKATNTSTISTLGEGSRGLIAQSIGGGGGAAGRASAFSFTAAAGTAVSLALSIGRSGGSGGTGGAVDVVNNGALSTTGQHATGVLAQSIGGGGGVGGGAASRAVAFGATSFAGALSIGGRGGEGGDGGNVSLNQAGTIKTTGQGAVALLAQSIGGGGGVGGLTHGDTRADNGQIAVLIGRQGGDGGKGGTVTLTQAKTGAIETTGIASDGVLLQSVGGGGGTGSSLGDKDFPPWPSPPPLPPGPAPEPVPEPSSPSYTGSLTIGLGGSGGAGGEGNSVLATNEGTITTYGRHSAGLIVQSIGGGGGRSGNSSMSAPGGDVSVSLLLGGSGGRGGSAGEVTATQAGVIRTMGSESIGLLAQSIGGGGGNVTVSEAGQGASKVGFNLALGGSGGTAAAGGKVTLTQSGTISALNGDALVAQSIGGGGGVAGLVNAGVSVDGTPAVIEWKTPHQGATFSMAVGGKGGRGGDGNEVNVTNTGTLIAGGNTHAGATLQSIGGGGGSGAMVSTSYTTSTLVPTAQAQIGVAVGGKGGSGGHGNVVRWTQDADGRVETTGRLGDGIRLQSLGGGGGIGGGLSVGATESDFGTTVKLDAATFSVQGSSGSSGNGGFVQSVNAAKSVVATQGEGAVGLVAQSVGGGGGMSNAVYAERIKRSTVNLGGGNGAGGAVDIQQHGVIETLGAAAHGVLTQSIGGGGGINRVIGVDENRPKAVFNSASAGKGDAGKVDINLSNTGKITTYGDGAFGILAQSIGGGGGYAYSGWHPITSQGPYWSVNTANQAGEGNGGAVNVRVDGSVLTHGVGAPGVFIQSIGGGGGLIDNLAGRAGNDGTGSSGPITLKVSGSVQALGKNSSGIFVQSLGSTVGSITVDVMENGTVQGGSDNAVGIELSGGKDNRISIAKGASVSAESGVAIRTRSYEHSTQLDNYGTLKGSIYLNQDAGGIVNNHGTMQAGDMMALSMGSMYTLAPGMLTNYGVFQVGGAEELAATRVMGDYRQEASGAFNPKVDFALKAGDVLTTAGAAYLDGTLDVDARNRLPTDPIQVFEAENGLTVADGFTVKRSEVFEYPLVRDGNKLLVGIQADFSRNETELSEEQSSVARYLGRKWTAAETERDTQTARVVSRRMVEVLQPSANGQDQGGSNSSMVEASQPGAEYMPVFDTVGEAEDTQAYADVLDQIANDAVQAPVAIIPLANRMFLNRTMACPSIEGTATNSQQQACLWGDIQGNWLNRDSRHHDSGFDYRSVRYMFGGQHPIANGWVAGGGISYEDVNGKATDTPLTTTGHNVTGVAFLRKVDGPWSYAGAVSAGRGSYDTKRSIRTVDGVVQPHADWNSYFGALRVQGAYTHQAGAYYVKPSMDVDVIYQRVPSYAEKGGGAFDLSFAGASDVRTMVSPSVEFGGQIEKAGLMMRPYMSVGVTWMPDNDWSTKASLKSDKTGDNFRLSQELPSVFAEYRVGVDIETQKGMVLRAAWRQRLGDRYDDRSAELQLGMRF